MSQPNAARSYFERVYPLLRGARPNSWSGWTRRWTEPGRSQRVSWVLSELERDGPLHVLDAGCGEGVYAVALAALGHRVTAVDFSPAMLEATRARAAAARVTTSIELIHADLREWIPSERFDVVLCLGVAEYYDEASELLARLFGFTRNRMLVTLTPPGGGLLHLARRWWLRAQGIPCRFFRRDELEATLAPLHAARLDIRVAARTHAITAWHARASDPRGPESGVRGR